MGRTRTRSPVVEPRPATEREPGPPAAPNELRSDHDLAAAQARQAAPAVEEGPLTATSTEVAATRPEAASRPRFTLYGSVTDAVGEPVLDPRVEVTFSIRRGEQRSTRLDSSGSFAFADLPPCFGVLRASGGGYGAVSVSDRRTWILDSDVRCDLVMVRERLITVAVRFLSTPGFDVQEQQRLLTGACRVGVSAEGQPLEVAGGRSWRRSPLPEWETDVTVPHAGDVEVELRCDDRVIGRQVVARDTRRVLFEFREPPDSTYKVTGRLVSRGAPVGGAVWFENGAPIGQVARAGRDGRFAMSYLRAGTWGYHATSAGAEVTSGEVELSGPATTVDLGDVPVEPGVRIAGVVIAPREFTGTVWIKSRQVEPRPSTPRQLVGLSADCPKHFSGTFGDSNGTPIDVVGGRGSFLLGAARGHHELTARDGPQTMLAGPRLVADPVTVDATQGDVMNVALVLQAVTRMHLRLADPWGEPVELDIELWSGARLSSHELTRRGLDLDLPRSRLRLRWRTHAGEERTRELLVERESAMVEIANE